MTPPSHAPLTGAGGKRESAGTGSRVLASVAFFLMGTISFAADPESEAVGESVAPTVVSRPARGPDFVLEALALTGFLHDPPGRPGLAAATASLVTKGTSRHAAGEDTDLWPGRCGDLYRITGREVTRFRMRFPADRLETCYAWFRDVIIAPSFDPAEVERLRATGSAAGEDPDVAGSAGLLQAADALDEMLYRDRPRAAGHGSRVAFTREEILAFHAAHYTRRRMILGAAGPDSDDLADRMRVDFAGLPAGAEARSARTRTVLPRRRVIVFESGVADVASVAIGQPLLVTRFHPDYVPLRIAIADLGGDGNEESRLFQAFRGSGDVRSPPVASMDGCAQGRASRSPTGPETDLSLSILFETTPEIAKFSIKAAVSEIEAFVEEGVAAKRLDRIRASLLRDAGATSGDPAVELDRAICGSFDVAGFSRRWPRSVQAAAPEPILSAIRAQLHPDRLGFAAVVPDAEAFIQDLLSQETRMPAGDRDRTRDRDLQIVGLDLGLKREDFEVVRGQGP